MIMAIDSFVEEKTQSKVLDLTASFFSENTPLLKSGESGGPAYEKRPQQEEMALGVAAAFSEKRNLCVEAPTGVGKSFAYLVPAIYYAMEQKLPVLISTETISLQEQLVEKDLPLLRKIMDEPFTVALAKGRGNYVCMRRLSIIAGEHAEYLPSDAMRSDAERIALWAQETEDGSMAEIEFPFDRQLWEFICCETGNCSKPKCHFSKRCFYWKARKSWDTADLIVANHAIFFTDLKIKSSENLEMSLLPVYGAVILDEAHTLEDSAAQHLGLHVSSTGLRLCLKRLYDPQKAKGLLMRSGEHPLQLRGAVGELAEAADMFFNKVREFSYDFADSTIRLRKPDFVTDILSEKIGRFQHMLEEYIREQEDEEDADLKQELSSMLQRCEYYRLSISDFVAMRLEDHVYWIERSTRNDMNIQLYAAPLNVNEVLQELLFKKDKPVVVTSATLSVEGNLEYYTRRIGFTNGGELVLDTPFDFERQVKIYISKQMPLPDEEGYLAAACDEIENYIRFTHGKAFVLFTSYDTMKKTAEKLRFFFENIGVTLLIQGEGKSRTVMLNEFKQDINSVIFGVASFWMGVDVPGEALSNVIITKLPFAVPSHPLVQARTEKLEREGGRSFMDYQLPEAVLRFRQGVGRLIRKKTDKGIIVILDRRVIAKRYGKIFLDSIPKCPVEVC
jgi:ATP-dependent DNA helicase DinG